MNETNTIAANDSVDQDVTKRMSTTDVTTGATTAFKNLIRKSTNKRMSIVDADRISIEASNITPKSMTRRMSMADLTTTVIAANSLNSKLLSRRSSIVDSNTISNNLTSSLTMKRGTILDSNSISRVTNQTVRKSGNKLISAVFTNAAAVAFNNLIGKRTNISVSPSIITTTTTTKSISTIINEQDENSRKKDRIIQNFLLIWFDPHINEKHDDYKNIVKSLERIVNAIRIFTDTDQCIEYLNKIKDEKIFIIISNNIVESFLFQIDQISQLDSIYIFSKDKILDQEEWTSKWFKVKKISTDILSICDLIEKDTQQCDQDMILISFASKNIFKFNLNFDQIDSSFFYNQLLKEILLETDYVNQESVQELSAYSHTFYVGNNEELKNISKFSHEYHLRRPLYWYQHTHFLYSMINRALRNLDMNTIFKIRFFIRDIHQDIKNIHLEQSNKYNETFINIYKTQRLTKINLDKLISNKGGLISFNNFFFATRNQEMSRNIVRQMIKDPQSIAIIFVIRIDPSISFAILNKIDSSSEFKQEIVLSIGSVFRIDEIKQIDDKQQIWEAELTLITNHDSQLKSINKSIRKLVESKSDWERFTHLLNKVGQFDKSEEVYLAKINQTSNDNEKADLYQQIGMMKKQRGDFIQTISFYEKALIIRKRILPSNHQDLIGSYKQIGEIYKTINEYSKSVWYYQKSLEIEQENLSTNNSLLANTYDTIAFLYSQLSEHSKSLTFYQKSLYLRQNAIPFNIIDIALSFNNIGSFYNTLHQYSKALSFYEQALNIYQTNLTSDNQHLANLYNNIGTTYYKINKYSKMLTFYQKALEINQNIIPKNDSLLATSYLNIGSAYRHLGEYSKALLYYNKSLDIYQTILLENHPLMIQLYDNIGSIYDNMNQYNKALEFYYKSFEIRKETLNSNDPQLAESYNNIGSIYYDLGDYQNALQFHQHAIDIGQLTLSSNHPDLHFYLNSFKMTKQKFELIYQKE